MSERSEREEAEARYGPQLDDLHEEELKRELRMEGSKLAKPKPTGNVCRSCVPIALPTPSGRIRLKHVYNCPEHPNEWIRNEGVRAGTNVVAEEALVRESERTNEVGAALAALVGLLNNPPKKSSAKIPTKKGGEFSYDYLNLPDLLKAIPSPSPCDRTRDLAGRERYAGGGWIETRVIHLSGQWIETGPLFVPATPGDPKATGSAVTYGSRYALCAILGIAGAEDDDAEKASAKVEPPTVVGKVLEGQGMAAADSPGDESKGRMPAPGEGTGEAGEETPTQPLPLPITEQHKVTLRERFGARRSLEAAREMFQTEERPIKNIGNLTADEAWQLIQALDKEGVSV